MATDGGKAVVVVLGLLGLGALVYFLVKSNDRGRQYRYYQYVSLEFLKK
jgi:hypothetical protein